MMLAKRGETLNDNQKNTIAKIDRELPGIACEEEDASDGLPPSSLSPP